MKKYLIMLFAVAAFTTPAYTSAGELSLKAAVAKTVAHNHILEEARAAEAVAAQGVISASGKHYPRLSFEASISRRQDSVPFIPAKNSKTPPHFSDSYSYLGPVLSIPLYQGGQIQAGVELAELRQKIQQDSVLITRNEQIANTVATYNKILQLQLLVAEARTAVSLLEEQQKSLQLRSGTDKGKASDLLRLDVQKANEMQRLMALDGGLRNAISNLYYLTGNAENTDSGNLILSDRLIDSPKTVSLEAGLALAKTKPKYRIFVKAVEDAEYSRKIAIGKLLPSLNAVAGYQQQLGFNPDYYDGVWYMGASLSIPVFDRSNYSEVSREQLQKERAVKKLRSVESQIIRDLQVSSTSLEESFRRIALTGKSVENARSAFSTEREKYAGGTGIMSDLLLAQSAESQAVANHAQALFDYNMAILDWNRASGDIEKYLK